MIEKSVSKSGLTSILINGIRYHSTYDPQKEAERFITKTIGNKQPSTVVLCGAGIGYIIDAVKKQFPFAKLIVIFYKKEFADLCAGKSGFFWYPGSGDDIKTFLYNAISELDLEGLQTIEWPQGTLLFPEISEQVHKGLSQIVKEKRGSIVTTIAMGRLWIRNSFLNFIHIDNVYTGNPIPGNSPVILTASGPSLEKSINSIKKWKDKLYIISLPSAVQCLMSHHITPDAIVMTDPGFYSMHHINWMDISSSVLFIPFSAATGIWKISCKVLFFTQPHFFEILLCEKSGLSFPPVPPKGTVAATALEIACNYADSDIIIAGLDLCYADMLSHARPHAFDTLLDTAATRVTPFYSQKYMRSSYFAPDYNCRNKIRTSLALQTYEGWFQSIREDHLARLIRLHPSPVAINRISCMETDEFEEYLFHKNEIPKSSMVKKIEHYPSRETRQRITKEILETWNAGIGQAIKEIKEAKTLTSLIQNNRLLELMYFLDLKGLTRTKRIVRLKGEAAGMEPALEMLDGSRQFVQRLYGKIEDSVLKAGKN
ncbi:MAG: DUF115 domain-containing protein [Spirochaetales bacterium]|nr:DUF115 domain-containing protein [Spirochaetales bacterium]